MLVDNHILQPSYFAIASAQSSYPEYITDLSDIFDTDLFNSTFEAPSSTSSGSRGSSPQNLLTPPQDVPPASFPEIHDDDAANQFYALFDDDLKNMNNPLTLPSTSADFLAVSGFDGSYDGVTGGAGANYNIDYGMGMDVSNMGSSIPPMQMRGIDPHLIDTPSAVNDQDEEQEEAQEVQTPPDVVEQPEQEKLTFTIAPVKVGGFGKARKGTVQSGGVVKKTPIAYANKASSEAGDHDEDDDDLPQDWRPAPEVLAKMTSKEKRQLRNKISARNFRVRRKGPLFFCLFCIYSSSLMTFSRIQSTSPHSKATSQSEIVYLNTSVLNLVLRNLKILHYAKKLQLSRKLFSMAAADLSIFLLLLLFHNKVPPRPWLPRTQTLVPASYKAHHF